ncbi:MAG: FAD-binding protein [bacterium]|nr:FAD-binding protein [bacterium]
MNTEQFLQDVQARYPQAVIKRDEPLHIHTAFKTGGPAVLFALVDSVDMLSALVTSAWNSGIRVKVLGGGTNILAAPLGFDGLVIKNNCRRFELQGMKGKFTNNQMKLSQAYLYAESGAITNQVVRYVIDQGFGGIEFALGLPGTVGGAVTVNANYPKENMRIGRAVYAGKILTKEGIKDVDNSYFHFGFDESSVLKEDTVLLSVLFALYPEEKDKLWARAEEAVTYRTTTQPKNFTTGMTFRNMTLTNLYPNSSLPRDVTPEFLLEKSGLLGHRVGDVELWRDNPHYVLNHGSGTNDDVEKLQQVVKETVFRRFGVQLEIQLHALV